jgi:streptogramin lyase
MMTIAPEYRESASRPSEAAQDAMIDAILARASAKKAARLAAATPKAAEHILANGSTMTNFAPNSDGTVTVTTRGGPWTRETLGTKEARTLYAALRTAGATKW